VAVHSPYPSARVGLRAMLAGETGIEIIDDASAAEVPGVAVIDLDDGGEERALPPIPSVLLATSPEMVSMPPPGDMVPRAYLLKDSSATEIVAAVRAVAAGLIVIDPSIAAALASSFEPGARSAETGLTGLTPRETEVLRLVAAGLPNKSIALQLGISDHTVKFHIGAILGKLGAASRAEAAARAIRAGILPL